MVKPDPLKPAFEPRRKGAWSLLLTRDFTLLWSGALVSNAGSWVHRVASAWVLYEMTGSAAWLGIDALASGLSNGLMLPVGGIIADRVDRRRVLIIGNILSAMAVLVLAIITYAGALMAWHIVAVSVASGVITAFINPASSALLPNVVGAARVADAISLNSIQFNSARVIGPVVGGFVLLKLGAAWCFSLNAVSFCFVAIAIGLLRFRAGPKIVQRLPFRHEMLMGVRLVMRRSELLGALAMIVGVASFAAPIVMLLPPFVKDCLRMDTSAYTLLVTAFGAGAIAGAMVLPRISDPSRSGWAMRMGFVIILLAIAQASLVLTHSFTTAIVVVALCGAMFVGTNVVLGTFLVNNTPDEFRGRISSLQGLGFRLAQPLGAFVGGLIATGSSVAAAFVSLSVALLAVGCALVFKPSILERPAFTPYPRGMT